MATKQQTKHVADLLNSEVVLRLKILHFYFVVNTKDLCRIKTTIIYMNHVFPLGARGSLVVKALRYKPAGRGFAFRWCHWNFSVT